MSQFLHEIPKFYVRDQNILLVREPKKSNLILVCHATAKTKKYHFHKLRQTLSESTIETDFVVPKLLF